MTKPNRYSPEVRQRAVRMVLDHEREYSPQWAHDPLDRGEDWLCGVDSSELGPAGRAEPRDSSRSDDQGPAAREGVGEREP